MTTFRWTTADLELFPDPIDDTRYEIIDGELYVSTQPSLEHQFACSAACAELRSWSTRTGRGFAFSAPGIILVEDDNVAPDVIWISTERFRAARGTDGKLHELPELVVEVLSPGASNERRDRDVKLKLYSRRSVMEYWIVDCAARQVEVYGRDGGALRLLATLGAEGELRTNLLPGFVLPVGQLFLPETV
jgi:Uma2 family endonuclease